jgi:hypothetical protein
MLLPRFTIRTILVVVTIFAFAFVVAGMAVRGEQWAWGVTIALISLALTGVVHAAWFGIVWAFARVPSQPPAAPARVVAAGQPVAPPQTGQTLEHP